MSQTVRNWISCTYHCHIFCGRLLCWVVKATVFLGCKIILPEWIKACHFIPLLFFFITSCALVLMMFWLTYTPYGLWSVASCCAMPRFCSHWNWIADSSYVWENGHVESLGQGVSVLVCLMYYVLHEWVFFLLFCLSAALEKDSWLLSSSPSSSNTSVLGWVYYWFLLFCWMAWSEPPTQSCSLHQIPVNVVDLAISGFLWGLDLIIRVSVLKTFINIVNFSEIQFMQSVFSIMFIKLYK